MSDIEFLKILYFAVIAFYIAVCLVRRKILINWPFILTAVAIHAIYFFGWEGILLLFFIGVISTAVELLSLKTAWNVFGVTYRYDLSHLLFPSRIVLLNVYPIEITGGWIFLKYLSFFLTAVIFFPLGFHPILKAVVAATMLVSFDLMLDPYAVSRGAWQWKKSGSFFGIPWQNFLGWFLVGLVISLLFKDLRLTTINEPGMILAVVVVCALTPLVTGWKLLSIDRTKAILAMAPLTLFICLGLYAAFF